MAKNLFDQFNILKFVLFAVATFVFIALLHMLAEWALPEGSFFTEPSIPLLFTTVLLAIIVPYMVFINNGKLDSKDAVGLAISAVAVILVLTYLPEQTIGTFTFGDNIVMSDFIKSLDLFKSSLGMP